MMRTYASPGSRLVVGSSGVVFQVTASVASGLVGNGTARYADEPVNQPTRPLPADSESKPEPDPTDEAEHPASPRRAHTPKR